MKGLVFGLSARDPLTIVLGCIVLGSVAVGSAVLPARATGTFWLASASRTKGCWNQQATSVMISRPSRSSTSRSIRSKTAPAPDDIDDLVTQLNDPGFEFTSRPQRIAHFTAFLNRVGTLKTKVGDWKELFWESAHQQQGD